MIHASGVLSETSLLATWFTMRSDCPPANEDVVESQFPLPFHPCGLPAPSKPSLINKPEVGAGVGDGVGLSDGAGEGVAEGAGEGVAEVTGGGVEDGMGGNVDAPGGFVPLTNR